MSLIGKTITRKSGEKVVITNIHIDQDGVIINYLPISDVVNIDGTLGHTVNIMEEDIVETLNIKVKMSKK